MIDSITEEGANSADLKRTKRVRRSPDSATMDRLPPHSNEAEIGVLGCCLLDPNGVIGECVTKLTCGPEAFYDLRHQTIFWMLQKMYDAREPIDVITLQQKLKDQQLLEQIGGITYLSALPDAVPSAANLSYYLDIVYEKYMLRRMINICTEVVGRVYDYEGEVDVLMDEVERDILAIGQLRQSTDTPPIKTLVQDAVSTIEDFHQRQGSLTGIATGFIDYDRLTGGLQNGEVMIIAARPSIGKTSLLMNICENICLDSKIPVGFMSLEMTARSLVLRTLCSRARVNIRNVREGFLTERDLPKIVNAAGSLAKAEIYIDDTSAMSVIQMRARARRMVQRFKIKVLGIDYLQLMHSTNKRSKNRQEEIADISSGVKSLAKELNIPIVILSQLNREIDRDKGRRPRLSDLRESGAIEQDGDVVTFLYHPDKDEAKKESDFQEVNWLVAKARNGPTGEIHLTFQKEYTRFASAAKVADEDIPQRTDPYPD